MSSIVYYRFLHQKTKSVIHFDGSSISVFDLKREIIIQNNLGNGQDFNLRLYHSEQPDLEYELDQDVIPRSSYVLVKRSPSNTRGGRFNNATRYISGKPRINRKAISSGVNPAPKAEATVVDENISEEDRIKLMFQNQSDAWAQTQDELSHHKMIYNKPTTGPTKPEDMPPPGYICYRCGKKDHWIKNCPTNTDTNFEGKKILRTTGIPKSYLKTFSKDEIEEKYKTLGMNENGDMVDQDGNAILLTEDGDFAIAMADSKTWSAYQEKQQNATLKAKQEFESKIVASIEKDSKPQFLNPLSSTPSVLKAPIVTTPCCPDRTKLQKMTNIYYNQSELEQLLIENDFYCPNCNTEDVYIDTLVENKEIESELKEYINEKEKELGIEDPINTLKRVSEDTQDEPDAKRAKVQNPGFPVPPPFVMPPGMQVPPMPVVMNPMFMPQPPFMNPVPPLPTNLPKNENK